MLRKIIELRDAIKKSTDDKARHANYLELNTVLAETRKSHLPCIRDEVREITVNPFAVLSIAVLGDSLIIPVILLISSELKSVHEARLSGLLQAQLGRDVVKECKVTSMIDLLNSLLPKPVERLFELFLLDKKSDQPTAASVAEFMSTTTTALCKALAARAKIDPAILSTEFTGCIRNELVRACMHEIFQVTDNQQTASFISTIFSGFSLSRDKIIKSYMALPFCALNVKPERVDLSLYAELAVWFEGLHHYHYKLLREKLQDDEQAHSVVGCVILMPENKRYPPVNLADVAMYKLYNLTFYDLAKHVLAASQVLVNALPAHKCDDDEIMVTVRVHGVFALNQSAASAAAAASVGSDVSQMAQSAPNLHS